jgi:Tfp pilus assembly protein PilV
LTKAPTRASAQSGFSIVEVMIAALILLVVAIGILPLFVNSIVSNAQGQDSTSAANFARSRLEEFKSLSFDDARLIIAAGNEQQYDEIYLFKAKKWIDGTTPPDGDWALWTRTTWVRQYQSIDTSQPPPYLTTPLPAGTDPSFVHLKEVEVRVVSNRNKDAGGFSFGAGKAVSARIFKAA